MSTPCLLITHECIDSHKLDVFFRDVFNFTHTRAVVHTQTHTNTHTHTHTHTHTLNNAPAHEHYRPLKAKVKMVQCFDHHHRRHCLCSVDQIKHAFSSSLQAFKCDPKSRQQPAGASSLFSGKGDGDDKKRRKKHTPGMEVEVRFLLIVRTEV